LVGLAPLVVAPPEVEEEEDEVVAVTAAAVGVGANEGMEEMTWLELDGDAATAEEVEDLVVTASSSTTVTPDPPPLRDSECFSDSANSGTDEYAKDRDGVEDWK
jgi:hypothetical protein